MEKIALKYLDLGKEVKCVCESCNGTGVNVVDAKRDGLAIICSGCNGKGYYIEKFENGVRLMRDLLAGNVYYKVKIEFDKMIGERVKLFDKLILRDDVEYVMYTLHRMYYPEYLLEDDLDEIKVVRYSEFINGKYPLPIMQYTCPHLVDDKYCIEGLCERDTSCCKKFGSHECWDKFYGDAKTIEQRREKMKSLGSKQN